LGHRLKHQCNTNPQCPFCNVLTCLISTYCGSKRRPKVHGDELKHFSCHLFQSLSPCSKHYWVTLSPSLSHYMNYGIIFKLELCIIYRNIITTLCLLSILYILSFLFFDKITNFHNAWLQIYVQANKVTIELEHLHSLLDY